MKQTNSLWARAAIVFGACLIALSASVQASTVPGAFAGELGVSPGGAATYQLPIQAPPGVAGMTPKVALVYNSQAGNGLLGKGWNIQGLPSIRRCPQTIASDGVRGRISYTQDDRFCLDDQHLVVVAGLYGGLDSEYRSEIDPFSRIRAIVSGSSANGPQHFIVQTKDGITLEFGSTNDSRIEAQGKTVVRSWLLSRMLDTLGNAIQFHYTEDNAAGEARIERISYAGRSITFIYEFRHDTQLAYQLGSAVRITQRLKAIETRIDAHLVHRYDISYTYGSTTGLSRVHTITQCAGDGSCLPPLIFQHSNSSELGSFDSGVRIINEPALTLANDGSNTANPELSAQEQLATKVADLNRDGAPDMLYAITGPSGARVYRLLGNGNGSFQAATVLINQPSLGSTAGCTPELADVNGDSLDDLLYVCAQSGGAKVHEWLGRSDGSFQWAGTLINDSAWGSLTTFQAHIADINGDGIVDLLYTHADISGAMALKWLGRGDGSFHAGVLATRSPNTITFEGFRPSLVDLNNDGLLDLLYTYTGSFGAAAYWFPNDGNGSFHAPQLVLNTNSFGNTAGCAPYVADLNNDGSADLLYTCAKSSGAFAYAWMGHGNGSFQAGIVAMSATALGSFEHHIPQLADINGDGSVDLIMTQGTSTGVRAQRWMGRGDGRFFDACCALNATAVGDLSKHSPAVVDIDGDELPDLLYYRATPNGTTAYRWRGQGDIPDRLNAIQTDHGLISQISYSSTRNPSVYTRNTTARHPIIESPYALQVVSRIEHNSGVGSLNTTTYRYGEYLYEHSTGPGRGRGPLGFRWTTSEEHITGIKRYTEYRQSWPYLGLSHFSQTLVNGRIIQQSATTFACYQSMAGSPNTPCGEPAPRKIYFPFAQLINESSYELSGAALPKIETRNTYGGVPASGHASGSNTVQLGDLTRIQIDILEAGAVKHRKTTVNQYHSANLSGPNWISGRLASATVTSEGIGLPAADATRVRASRFAYNPQGLLIAETLEPDSPQDCLHTAYQYDAAGNRSASTSSACAGASGHTLASASAARSITNRFDAQSISIEGKTYTTPAGVFATQSSNSLGHTEHKRYDPRHGQIIELTGPNGLSTRWTYDGFGRKISETRADGTRSQWQYKLCAPPGQARDSACPAAIGSGPVHWYVLETVIGTHGAPIAAPKYQFHDILGRAVRTQTHGFDGAGPGPALVQDSVYNTQGQITYRSVVYPLAGGDPRWTIYTRDALGRVIRELTPDGSGQAITTYTYNGLTTTATNAKGQTQTKIKNATGQLAKVIDALGGEITYHYDALGQLTQTNAAGAITRLTYDQRGRKVRMQDSAMGLWEYAHNAFGELVWQQDSLSQITTLEYDRLGRLRKRSEPDIISEWSYDTAFDGSACGASIGQLCEARADNGYRRRHNYDPLGRPSQTATVLSSSTDIATTAQSYEATSGRLASQTWPTGYRASYHYTPLGYLKTVSGAIAGDSQSARFEVLAMDPQGHITQYRQGEHITTVRAFDPVNGKQLSAQATTDGAAGGKLLHHTYTYDALGNLLGRQDHSAGLIETYSYDNLNRLSLHTAQGGGLAAPISVQTLYDAAGNLKYKSDVGYYHYDPSRPSRLAQITLSQPSGWTAQGSVSIANTGTRALSYAFDDARAQARTLPDSGLKTGNGNLWYTVSQDHASGRHTVRWESHTSFGKAREIYFGNLSNPANPVAAVAERTLTFLYGPEHQRIKQTVTLSNNAPSHMQAGTTWYLNGLDGQGLSYEKEIKSNGSIEHKHYLSAGGIVFALYTQREAPLNGQAPNSLHYWHHDHLGSLAAISSASGQLIERLAFDPWGKRRYADGKADTQDQLSSQNTDRGYTLHEHLDEVGVIHMNGRIYDPLIGRFMSADPFIQSPDNLQSHNRYAYVLNNPLAYTDPSGYFSFKKLLRIGLAIAAAYYLGPQGYFAVFGSTQATVGALIISNVANGALAGFVSGAIMSGNMKGALNGGLSGGLFSFVGVLKPELTITQLYVAHAAAGCVSALASAGHCGSGAAAALFGKFTSQNIDGLGITDKLAKGIITAVAGGTSSVIGGGKFKNGATTSAFVYLVDTFTESTGGSGRPLTEDERAEAVKAYGNKIKDYGAIRIYDGKWFFFQSENVAMTINNNIYYPGITHCTNLVSCVLSVGGYRASTLPTFIHELAHVMQYQNGMNVILNAGAEQVFHYATFKLYNPYLHNWSDFYATPSPANLNPEAQADWHTYNHIKNRHTQ